MASRYAVALQGRADLIAESTRLFAAAESAQRGLTDPEKARDDAIAAQLVDLDAELSRWQRQHERERGAARSAPAPTEEFASLGQFMQAVAASASPDPGSLVPNGRELVARLHAYQAASGASTGVPADGGFLVRKDWSTALLARAIETSMLAPRCLTIGIGEGADGIELPFIDETSRATGSRWGGVQVYRRSEAATVTATKPAFGRQTLDLEDLMAIFYATERSLRDATSLQAIAEAAFASEFAFKVDDELIRGTGVGSCLGILNSSALVSVAKETSQIAATFVAENALKMRSRMHPRSWPRSAWFINADVWPQLPQMLIKVKNVAGTENVGGVPVWVPGGGVLGNEFDLLLGRPVIPIEQAETLGTKGDIILADWSQYLLINKGGLESANSMHVRFLYDEMTFRWKYRVNGQPTWRTALTPYKGTATLSPFIVLDTRA